MAHLDKIHQPSSTRRAIMVRCVSRILYWSHSAWRCFGILRRTRQLRNAMSRDRPGIRPTAVEVGGWIVDGLIVLALCIAATESHRIAFGFFALFAVAGFATRLHWTAAYVIPNGLRALIALLYLASSVLFIAAAFDLLSGPTTDAARWAFTAACAITLAARIAGWLAAVIPTDATE